ncbi:MAG TPA: sigma-70 family RNA polymerase sigma factor [Thermoanaerobaculia bacterium]|nr:sigma-70 family RNA polymerase sigma factor [Thermoanaerobaculia bacterium]
MTTGEDPPQDGGPLSDSRAPLSDPEQFRKVFDENFPRLRAFFCSRGFKPADAEDLSQTVLLSIYRSWNQYRGSGTRAAWIFAVAWNVARERWRKVASEAKMEGIDAVTETRFDEAPSTDQVVSDREELERTVEALKEVPPRMRACLLLQVQEGLSHKEIAHRLGLSPRTVRVQIWNARTRLRQLLERPR